MVKYFVQFVLLLFMASCSTDKLSRMSKAAQPKKKVKSTLWPDAHKVRMEALRNYDSAISMEGVDTLFILETLYLNGWAYYGSMWCKNFDISYHFDGKSFEYQRYFPTHMRELLQRWDTSEIRKEETINSNLNHSGGVRGYRVTRHNNSYKAERIYFNEFFKLGRDNYPYDSALKPPSIPKVLEN